MAQHRPSAVRRLIVIGYSVAVAAIALFYFTFVTSTKELKQVSEELFQHPFTVHSAAANMKVALYQIRSESLLIVLMRMQYQDWDASIAKIDGFELTARQKLALIQTNFLGDKSRVALLEQRLNAWREVRTSILQAVKRGDFATAERQISTEGSPRFNAVVAELDYVLNFSLGRANQFVEDASAISNAVLFKGQLVAAVLLFAVLATGFLVVNRVQNMHRELTKHATTDALTGVSNRRNFLDLVAYEASRSDRYGQQFSIAIVDIDHFKKVNDSYGHQVGDTVLKHFCALCQAGLRQSDAMGRLGGEEFGILLPNTELSDAATVLERIRQSFADSPLLHGTNEIVVSGSFGVVSSVAGTAQTNVEALLKAADLAMYTAKSQGRNQVVSNATEQQPNTPAVPQSAAA